VFGFICVVVVILLAMDSEVELYDSDILALERVVAKLNSGPERPRSFEEFSREAIERFEDAGYVVTVSGDIGLGGGQVVFLPEITIVARIDKRGEFDHEKMAWEVQHDILGIDDNPGAVQPDGTVRAPEQATSLYVPKK
jgi:hypothetical protein